MWDDSDGMTFRTHYDTHSGRQLWIEGGHYICYSYWCTGSEVIGQGQAIRSGNRLTLQDWLGEGGGGFYHIMPERKPVQLALEMKSVDGLWVLTPDGTQAQNFFQSLPSEPRIHPQRTWMQTENPLSVHEVSVGMTLEQTVELWGLPDLFPLEPGTREFGNGRIHLVQRPVNQSLP